MIDHQTLANFILDVSLTVYSIRYFPQIIHNWRHRHTNHISLWTQSILLIGYTADCLYGIGCGLPWQYRLVSYSGMFMLLVQHVQIGLQIREHTDAAKQRLRYYLLTLAALLWIVGSITAFLACDSYHCAMIYGYVAMGSWMTNLLFQMRLNYVTETADGFHGSFIFTGLFCGACDLASGLLLSWPLPSIITASWTIVTFSFWAGQWWWYGYGKHRHHIQSL